MWLIFAFGIIFFFPQTSCYWYLNRTEIENSALTNATVDYYHDEFGQCIANATFWTFVTINKMLIYFKINTPENKNDKEFKKAVISTVIEVDKVFKGMQSNIIISATFSAIKDSMSFDYKTPLPPVRNVLSADD